MQEYSSQCIAHYFVYYNNTKGDFKTLFTQQCMACKKKYVKTVVMLSIMTKYKMYNPKIGIEN